MGCVVVAHERSRRPVVDARWWNQAQGRKLRFWMRLVVTDVTRAVRFIGHGFIWSLVCTIKTLTTLIFVFDHPASHDSPFDRLAFEGVRLQINYMNVSPTRVRLSKLFSTQICLQTEACERNTERAAFWNWPTKFNVESLCSARLHQDRCHCRT